MNSRHLLALIGAAILAAPLAAQPVSSSGPLAGSTTLTFNALTAGTVLSTQYPGVTISNGLCASSDYTAAFARDPIQVTNFQAYTSQLCNGVKGQPFTFNFAAPISSFGFLGVTNGGIISFTTSNGTLTPTLYPVNAIIGFVGVTDVNPFTSVQVNVSGDGYIALDDVSFTTTVPEPTSVVLVAAGLIGALGVARRRKQRNG